MKVIHIICFKLILKVYSNFERPGYKTANLTDPLEILNEIENITKISTP